MRLCMWPFRMRLYLNRIKSVNAVYILKNDKPLDKKWKLVTPPWMWRSWKNASKAETRVKTSVATDRGSKKTNNVNYRFFLQPNLGLDRRMRWFGRSLKFTEFSGCTDVPWENWCKWGCWERWHVIWLIFRNFQRQLTVYELYQNCRVQE